MLAVFPADDQGTIALVGHAGNHLVGITFQHQGLAVTARRVDPCDQPVQRGAGHRRQRRRCIERFRSQHGQAIDPLCFRGQGNGSALCGARMLRQIGNKQDMAQGIGADGCDAIAGGFEPLQQQRQLCPAGHLARDAAEKHTTDEPRG